MRLLATPALVLSAFILVIAPLGEVPAAETPSSGSNSETKGTFWLIPHTHWEGAVFKTREQYLEMGLPNILTDRKSTRLNSSHLVISYAVFCLKKKKNHRIRYD